MKIRNLAILGATTVVYMLWLWLRHHTLDGTRADIATLHEQLADQSSSEGGFHPQSDTRIAQEPKMSDAEERELLRLRGLIRPLRQQIVVSSNSLVILAQAGIQPMPAEPDSGP